MTEKKIFKKKQQEFEKHREAPKNREIQKNRGIPKSSGMQKHREVQKHAENAKEKSPCPVYGKCGGCQLLHFSYQEQLELKKKQISRLLSPYCKVEEIIGMEQPEHYRCKVHATFGRDKKGNVISGIYKEGTHQIVAVKECLLEDQKADAIIETIRGLLKSFKIKTYDEDTDYGLLRHVLVRKGYATGQVMVVLVLASPILPSKNNFVKALRKEHPEITTVVVNVNDRHTSMVLGDKQQVIYGSGYIEDKLCGMVFKISPKSFYQVNPPQAERLYGKAMEYAGLSGKEVVVDAYCGTGTIGMIAAQRARKVIGVEYNPESVKDAIANARKNQVSNIRFYQADAGDFLVKMADADEKIDVVLMDPPRSGSSERFLSSLIRLKPEKIVYISCNPETLARDLKYLCSKGYKAKRAAAVDMFPFTDDCEACVLLE